MGSTMNSSPISKLQTNSRGRLSDLCHMRRVCQSRTRPPCSFISHPSQRVTQFGTAHDLQARNEFVRRAMCGSACARDVRSRATAGGCSTNATQSLQTVPTRSRQKKEAGFPAPLAKTHEVHFVFFLAAAIRNAAGHTGCCERAFARNPRRRWCFGSPAFVPGLCGRSVALRPCLATGVPLRSADSQAVSTSTPARI
jgi:hypothetical protein